MTKTTKITNIFKYDMSETEVLQLMTGLVNIKHFTKFYLNSIKYNVKIDHHLTGDFLIYVNNVLVFQQSPDNYDLSKLKNTIKIIKNNKVIDNVNDGSCEEDDEDDDEDDDDDDDEDDDEDDECAKIWETKRKINEA